MLKKNNYIIQKFGQTINIPTVYAMIEDFKIDFKTETAKALFVIKAERNLDKSVDVIDEVWVDFPLSRNEHIYTSAYKTAKGQHYENIVNEETNKVEKVLVNNSVLYGWEDDIV